MPHDIHGKVLSVGDSVIIRGRIKEIHNTEEYCNCTLVIAPMPPNREEYIISAINTQQTEKVERTI